jgi:2-polyprenyl-6-methoxyphenol hydroxylase-like FAD-dependent oxidoreductase
MAFESAWEMAHALEPASRGSVDWTTALETFEQQRKPRAQLVQQYAILIGKEHLRCRCVDVSVRDDS